MQFENPSSSDLKVMTKVKVFEKYVKLQSQGHQVKNYDMMRKILSQGMHICNIKALAVLIWKLLPRLKFLKNRSNFKVKVTR